MIEIFLFFIALAMIAIAWGFWPFLAAIVFKIAIVHIFKPKYSSDMNWGTLVAQVCIIIAGIVAVNDKWHEPIYTAAAVVVTIVLIALELKD